jgi:hypothetical protein
MKTLNIAKFVSIFWGFLMLLHPETIGGDQLNPTGLFQANQTGRLNL